VARRETSYERLEFLGDSVLGLVIAHHLYERFPESPEGDLAKVRAHVVSRDSCAAVAVELGLDDDVRVRGAQLGAAQVEIDALSHSPGVLAAVTEAVVGAAYLDAGVEAVAGPVVDAFSSRIEYALAEHVDAKTVLQEELARRGASVTYAVADVSGPPHLRWFTLHDAWSLVEQAGLAVADVERRIRYRRVGGAKETAAARLIARVPGPRAFLTYQHIITARKLASSGRT